MFVSLPRERKNAPRYLIFILYMLILFMEKHPHHQASHGDNYKCEVKKFFASKPRWEIIFKEKQACTI